MQRLVVVGAAVAVLVGLCAASLDDAGLEELCSEALAAGADPQLLEICAQAAGQLGL